MKSLASAAVLDHSHNALLRVWLAWVLVCISKVQDQAWESLGCHPAPCSLPGAACCACTSPGSLHYIPLPCSCHWKKAFSSCCCPWCPHVILCPQGSDANWLLPAIDHIANIIGEKKKDKIKAYVKELCQDYPDIRYVKRQMPELLGSIPKSTSLLCAWPRSSASLCWWPR